MKSFTPSCLALAVAAGLFAALPAQAGTLNPGESATLEPGSDPNEQWDLTGATLIMKPNAASGRIEAKASLVDIDGGVVIHAGGGGGVFALSLVDDGSGGASTGTVRNATVSGPGGILAAQGSSLLISDSNVTGGQYSALELEDKDVTGSLVTVSNSKLVSAQSQAVFFIRTGAIAGTSRVELADNSLAKGETHAVEFYGDVSAAQTQQLVVDASHLESGARSALFVRNVGSAVLTADIDLNNGTTVTTGNGVLLETEGAVTAHLNINNSAISGDILNDKANGATTVVGLRNNAVLTGAMTDVSGVSIESAQWNVTGDSSVDFLQLKSGGVVAFEAPTGGVHKNLTVGNFSGNDGTIVFNTVLADDASLSDKLVVTGDTSGTANVRVKNIGGAGAETVNGIELIEVGGSSDGVFALAGRAVGGAHEYFLHKGGAGAGSEGNWYLRSSLREACDIDPTGAGCDPNNPGPLPGPAPGDEEPYPMPEPKPDPEPILRPEGGAYLANVQAAQQMFAIGYHGRQQGQNGAGAWAKVDGSRNGFDAVSRQLDVRGNSQALSVGANLWQHESGSSAGVMLSSGNATSTSTNELTGYYARGKVKGEALGIYGTWRGSNAADPYAGFYVDGSVQRAQFRNRVEGVGLETERYTSRAWQGAVEAGYAFRVGGASNGGIYLEPQLQVGYTRWEQGQHTEANGTVVQTEDANGLFGRAGVRLSGVTRAVNGGVEVQPYVAAHWLHTRAGSQIRMNDEIVDARIPQNRGEFSAGASLNFGNGFGAWGGLSLQKASGYHQTSAQVGLSYRW